MVRKTSSKNRANRLIDETSPYLQQHAHNPVDWYPWGEEALEQARKTDKPILLSIGYSACHWCHVMERESFEDPETARVMNEHFVCIKVDREERPDLDRIYQTAHQMLLQRAGGWPLNMFLTPKEHMPFFGGTYFPPEPRYGMPAFHDLLQRVAEFYTEHRSELHEQNASLADVFRRLERSTATEELSDGILAAARAELGSQYDRVYGGFGNAPKFPHPGAIERFLRWVERTEGGDDEALNMAVHTLTAMANGGIHDQIGGGFCRYSVDERWMIPHFEKMLYDNAQLITLYADAWLLSGEELFRRTAEDIGEWVLREMQSEEGAFFATLDADSEGEEGRYYVWQAEEVRAILDEKEWDVCAKRWGFDREANFEGKWNPYVHMDSQDIAAQSRKPREVVDERITSGRAKLLGERSNRVAPARDEKVLTSWNGLMIHGMARAGRVLDRRDFIDSAMQALDFVRANLWQDGRLLASAKDGKAHLNAYLDDYAFLALGVLELLQARWRDEDLEFAQALADAMLNHFEDGKVGGFFFTSDDHETLVYRPKPVSDEAVPSGNGIAALVLLRLGHLLGETRYLVAAERTLHALMGEASQHPGSCNALLTALEEFLYPGEIVVIRGPEDEAWIWAQSATSSYAPRRMVVSLPPDSASLPDRPARDQLTAYVCTGRSCSPPIDSGEELDRRLA
ncbi:MAG: thioredoxin domain-containing protein [Acidiferrobacteraceae bacterium]|jgi:uncharacterized protein YyaL (SSP411 family)